MPAHSSLLLSDANEVRGRANDGVLPLPKMRTSLEGALTRSLLLPLTVLAAIWLCDHVVASDPIYTEQQNNFEVVVYTCIWQRPKVTAFVLQHYQQLRADLSQSHITLSTFVVGSEGNSSQAIALRHGASYIEAPNEPLGAKHNRGLSAVRDAFPNADAVVVVGSDDVLNSVYFKVLRRRMEDTKAPIHILGLRDLYFYDLSSDRLAYTRGYRKSETKLAASVGLGRAFSRSTLDLLDWTMWESDRNRGLDQSAVRRILTFLPWIELVTDSIHGWDEGVMAVDLKSSGLEQNGGINIWSFESIMAAGKSGGKLHDFNMATDPAHDLAKTMGPLFPARVSELRKEMTG